jgi:transposase-like protein
MGRKRRPEEPGSYRARPQVPPSLQLRYETITAALAGQITMSEAAERVGIARVNFQSLVHRAQAAMLQALEPRPSGRAPKPPEVKELEAKVKKLEAEVARLTKQVHSMDELLGVAGDVIRDLRGMPPLSWRKNRTSPRSSRRSRRSPTRTGGGEDPEPAATAAPPGEDPKATALLARIAMTDLGARAACAIGMSAQTLRRWRARRAAGTPARCARSRQRPLEPAAESAVRQLVRDLNGLAGAASLSHSIDGVSRRQAAALKADELRLLERERQAACERVEVLRPGVVRGFDAMHLATPGARFALVSGDACVPYRTSALLASRYDAVHVAKALEADFEAHGAPLVWRRDRALCHGAEPVASVLEGCGVLALEGPPHHPGYYGQLERMMREHRAWLYGHGELHDGDLEADWERMRFALNALWRRPTLSWQTAASVWEGRQAVTDDRDELRDEVHDRAARLRRESSHPIDERLAMRLAIEKALANRGYLRVHPGRRVLRD